MGAYGKYVCPYCGVPSNILDHRSGELMKDYQINTLHLLPEQPDIQDLKGNADNGRWQRKDTFNLFNFKSDSYPNMAPPPLHIRRDSLTSF